MTFSPQRSAQLVAMLRKADEQSTAAPWMGPRITDDYPPGWIGIYAADENGEAVPGYVIGISGHHAEGEPDRNMAVARFMLIGLAPLGQRNERCILSG